MPMHRHNTSKDAYTGRHNQNWFDARVRQDRRRNKAARKARRVTRARA